MRTVEIAGGCPLTQAELRVLSLVMEGLTYQQIATVVRRSTSTVRSHLHSAYKRLGVTTSHQAVLICVRSGWLAWDDGDPERAVFMRIEELVRHLVIAVEQRRGDEREKLTPAQRRYLEAFDTHLQASSRMLRADSRRALDRALSLMLEEAEVSLQARRGPRDLVQTLGGLVDAELDGLAA